MPSHRRVVGVGIQAGSLKSHDYTHALYEVNDWQFHGHSISTWPSILIKQIYVMEMLLNLHLTQWYRCHMLHLNKFNDTSLISLKIPFLLIVLIDNSQVTYLRSTMTCTLLQITDSENTEHVISLETQVESLGITGKALYYHLNRVLEERDVYIEVLPTPPFLILCLWVYYFTLNFLYFL